MSGNEIEIRVARKGDGDLDKLGRDGKRAGQDVAQGLEKGFREGEQAGDRMRKKVRQDLDKTAKDAKDAGGKAGHDFGAQFGDNIESAVSGDVEGIIGGLTDNLKNAGGIAAAGAGIGAVLMTGIGGAFEKQSVGTLLAAQTGSISHSAGDMGRVAGDIFADNFGDSLADVGDAMRAVFQTKLVDADAAEADIKRITESALAMSQTTGASVEEISRAVRSMLTSGLATDADHAFDLITVGFQKGANAGGDLIDVLTNSAVNLKQFGMDGEQAIGVLIQALNAGAPSADAFTGALEELIGNASDGIATFERLGLGGESFADKLAGGGPAAAQALDILLDRIRKIESPSQRAATMVELFGEEATALQKAILAVDPSEATRSLGEFSGAAQAAADTLGDSNQARVEGFFRGIKKTAIDVAGTLIQAYGSDLPEVLGATEGRLEGGLKLINGEFAGSIKKRADEDANAWRTHGAEIEKVVQTLDKFIGKQREALTEVLDLSSAEIGYQKALDDAADAAKENGRTLDLNTEKGRENRESLNDIAQATYEQVAAMEQQGSTLEEVAGFLGTAREQFIELAIKMGLSKSEAGQLADKLRLIPGDYRANVSADTVEASNAVRTIHGQLVNLTNRSWIASVAVTGRGMAGGGRYFAGLEHGGIVGMSHAAEGGPRGNMTLVGEHGPELVDLAPGSMVHSNPDTMRMLGQAGGGGWVPTTLEVRWTGDSDSALASALKKMQRDGLLDFLVR